MGFRVRTDQDSTAQQGLESKAELSANHDHGAALRPTPAAAAAAPTGQHRPTNGLPPVGLQRSSVRRWRGWSATAKTPSLNASAAGSTEAAPTGSNSTGDGSIGDDVHTLCCRIGSHDVTADGSRHSQSCLELPPIAGPRNTSRGGEIRRITEGWRRGGSYNSLPRATIPATTLRGNSSWRCQPCW
jgi:hypothetical protein